MNNKLECNHPKGLVVLAGAGPGDPDLITIKLAKRLAVADILLVDRLVSPEICRQFAPHAIMVQVGKQCRKGKSTPQQVINEMMVHHATAGRNVVRLKGGDSSIFSNLLDELLALKNAAIPFEIIPGITAASGVAAEAGMPLTARGLSQGVHFITCYKKTVITELQWQFYAQTDDTLVFYMSGEMIGHMQEKLTGFGKPQSTPVLLAEQATTPQQRFRIATLESCVGHWKNCDIISPAMLVVGNVAALHQQFFSGTNADNPVQWFDDASAPAEAGSLAGKSNYAIESVKLVAV